MVLLLNRLIGVLVIECYHLQQLPLYPLLRLLHVLLFLCFSVYRSDENIIKRWKIMNEKLVFKKSFFIFLIGFIVFSIIGLMMKSISYSLGFLLGYLFNLAIFYVIIITSDMILNLKRSTSLIILLNIVKLAIYAIGFLIAIFIPKWFNLIGVLFGYMVIKITIYIVSYQMKGVKG